MASEVAPDPGRRSGLQIAAALAGLGLLPGCSSLLGRDLAPVCPTSPDVSWRDGPLTIDAHCHVFNGSDLQVREFFRRVAVRQGGALGFGADVLGSVLEQLAWSLAPSGGKELQALRRVSDALKEGCTDARLAAPVGALRQEGYATGRQQLQLAAARSADLAAVRGLRSLDGPGLDRLDVRTAARVDALRLIEGLPPAVEDYRAAKAARRLVPLSLRGLSVQGLIEFVLQNFQYRYVSVHDYLRTYNRPGERVVDLMLPSMVDYDFWLAQGGPTPTSLPDQVQVMRQLALLTGGRVHALVPFDPLRQVAHDLGLTSTDSLALVKDAVGRRGCLGVKLYPPMGFAVAGNKDLKRDTGRPFWARDWLPDWTGRTDLGLRLDAAMAGLLSWCEREDVPVMAHTALSNGPADDFEALAGATHWAEALREHPTLRVSFGHFGHSSPVEDNLDKAHRFTALMASGGTDAGARAFADAGYFVEVLRKRPALLRNLRQLYEEDVPPGRAPLASRFMYGTDWEMTLTEGAVDGYLADFVRLFDDLETRPAVRKQGVTGLSDRFFGWNAVEWAGLRKGEPARRRLEAFYAEHGVPTPDWAHKVG